jgi:hypothetical protein
MTSEVATRDHTPAADGPVAPHGSSSTSDDDALGALGLIGAGRGATEAEARGRGKQGHAR